MGLVCNRTHFGEYIYCSFKTRTSKVLGNIFTSDPQLKIKVLGWAICFFDVSFLLPHGGRVGISCG